jgi:hypothetical protein
METRLIERIHRNTRSITLLRSSDGIYSVTFREGTSFKGETFDSLKLALDYFNELSGMFEDGKD